MTLFEEQSVMLFENEVSANDYFVRSSTLSMIWIQTMEIALWTSQTYSSGNCEIFITVIAKFRKERIRK